MGADLRAEVARLWGAYRYLRDHDLSEQSGTSRLLRTGDMDYLRGRLSDELGELAGVMDGTHRHHGLSSDVVLEGSQVCYWTYILAIRQGVNLEALDPAARLSAVEKVAPVRLAERVRHHASLFAAGEPTPEAIGGVLTLVGQCCNTAGVDPADVVSYDLRQMRSRPYMEAYFAERAGSG